MQENNKGTDREVQFNLGDQQLRLIGKLLHNSSEAYIRGSPIYYYTILQSLKMAIISRLDASEKEELRTKELEINKMFFRCKKANLLDENKRAIFTLRMTYPVLEKYDERLHQLLETKGFLVPLRPEGKSLFGQNYEE